MGRELRLHADRHENQDQHTHADGNHVCRGNVLCDRDPHDDRPLHAEHAYIDYASPDADARYSLWERYGRCARNVQRAVARDTGRLPTTDERDVGMHVVLIVSISVE